MALTSKPAQLPLRIPKELYADVQQLAQEQGVSMNQFLLYVVTSKVSEMKQSKEFFQHRSSGRTRQQSADGLKKLLEKVSPARQIAEGDELPDPGSVSESPSPLNQG